MKKKAFTLAETLIAVGIIGIIAAVLAPAINSARPDQNKIMYLKAADALTEVVQDLASNRILYPDLYNFFGASSYNVSHYPLMNTERQNVPSTHPLYLLHGESKFPFLISRSMNGQNRKSGHNSAGVYVSYTTNNGKFIWRVYNSNEWTPWSPYWSTTVLVDINGDSSMSKLYVPGKYENIPTTFQFCVTASGNVIPADVFGQMYMEDRTDLKKRSKKEEINAVKQGISNNKYRDLTSTVNFDETNVPVRDIIYNGG